MNQGRIWCVVHPTVGLPLLLGSVAVTSLIVHTAILTHSGWYGAYVGANARVKTAALETDSKVAAVSAPAYTVTVTPAAAGSTGAAFTVSVTPNVAVVAEALPDTPLATASLK